MLTYMKPNDIAQHADHIRIQIPAAQKITGQVCSRRGNIATISITRNEQLSYQKLT